jgi:hypothetical protein
MAKTVVTWFGWIFIIIGILGFIPGITSDGMLLGIFEVSAVHNIVHLLSGIIALAMAAQGEDGARTYAKIFGVVYLLVTLLGFFTGSFIGLFEANGADNVLHLLLAVIFLWAGFSGRREAAPAAM